MCDSNCFGYNQNAIIDFVNLLNYALRYCFNPYNDFSTYTSSNHTFQVLCIMVGDPYRYVFNNSPYINAFFTLNCCNDHLRFLTKDNKI